MKENRDIETIKIILESTKKFNKWLFFNNSLFTKKKRVSVELK